MQPEKTALQAGAAVALAAVVTPLAAVLAENQPKAESADPRTAQETH